MGIDAVTSALATLPNPAVGLASAQRDRGDSAPRQEEPQTTAPRVVFNPRSHFDASAGVFVMEYRSASTGEVERQFPDENQLRAYAAAKKLEAARERTEGAPEAAAEPKAAAPEKAAPVPAEASAAAPKPHQPVRIEV